MELDEATRKRVCRLTSYQLAAFIKGVPLDVAEHLFYKDWPPDFISILKDLIRSSPDINLQDVETLAKAIWSERKIYQDFTRTSR